MCLTHFFFQPDVYPMIDSALETLDHLQIELPSWGFANTGTRFGKFVQAGAAIDIADKLADAGMVNQLMGCCPTVAVHVLWDFVKGQGNDEVVALAEKNGVKIGSINPNLFQDQEYKLGSFANPDAEVRDLALQHSLDSIQLGQDLNSDSVVFWFADGTNYPGQDCIRERKHRFEECLKKAYAALSPEQTMLVEYKPFEPAFYHTDVADWGMSYLLCKQAGPQAKTLVDTGHHYNSQNIEQIVAWLLDDKMLGGFHFNDRRYADDDLTLGSIDPYQIFRIFNEIHAYAHDEGGFPEIAYMVDQSHNLKPKMEAMIQTVDTAQDLWLKAALVDRDALKKARVNGNVVDAENELKKAFNTNIAGPLGEWRTARGLEKDSLVAYRNSGYAEKIASDRTQRREAMGDSQSGAYA